jgi:uncharacterized membrane protein
VTPAEQAALGWVRAHLPRQTVMQFDPVSHGRGTWALIPAFGERRIGVGLALFEPNPRRFDAPMADARRIFASPETGAAYDLCERYGVHEIWVGPEERAAYGTAADKFGRDRERFVPLYDAGGVSIYRVRPRGLAQRRRR